MNDNFPSKNKKETKKQTNKQNKHEEPKKE